MDLTEMIKIAKSVSLGSMDGIHDVIRDAEIHNGDLTTFQTVTGGQVIASPALSRDETIEALHSYICDRFPAITANYQKKIAQMGDSIDTLMRMLIDRGVTHRELYKALHALRAPTPQ